MVPLFSEWKNALRDLLHVHLSEDDVDTIVSTNVGKLREHYCDGDEVELVAMLILDSIKEMGG